MKIRIIIFLGMMCAVVTNSFAVPYMYVTGYDNNKIVVYDGDSGTQQSVISGSGINGPHHLTAKDGLLYVTSRDSHQVMRFNASTGEFVDIFVPAGSGGLNGAHGITIGPDDNLYVVSRNTNAVIRYNGLTGDYDTVFTTGSNLDVPTDVFFGPDGDMYVCSVHNNTVQRYDGTTGAALGAFASTGLSLPMSAVFGPDGRLYVSNYGQDRIDLFDGTTGVFISTFVTGVDNPTGLTFGPDGNLYVCERPAVGNGQIARFDGLTGTFIDVFASGGSLGTDPVDVIFYDPDIASQVIPEPASICLLATGLFILGRRKRT